MLDFSKFLLFHPLKQMTYIRKLSMSYGYYTVLAVVNRNNWVTHVGVDNDFNIVPFKELISDDCKLLGSERCSALEDEDLLSIYRINKVLELKHPVHLVKGCRSMRYSTNYETYHLKKAIMESIASGNVPVSVNRKGYYVGFYGENVELDLNSLDNVEFVGTDGDWLGEVVDGQTRLI